MGKPSHFKDMQIAPAARKAPIFNDLPETAILKSKYFQ
jgi:hypothetical protein